VQAVLVAAAARDLARRIHLPVLGAELDMVVPPVARTLLVTSRRDEPETVETARAILELVERFADVVADGTTSPATAVRRLESDFPAEIVSALIEHFDDRLPGSGGEGPRILLAGDSKRHTERMEKAGLTVVPVADGHEAWEILRTSRVDGAVLPARLPGRDGLSLLSLCRGRDELRDMPVWLTGRAFDQGDRRLAEERGAVVVDGDASRLRELVVARLLKSS